METCFFPVWPKFLGGGTMSRAAHCFYHRTEQKCVSVYFSFPQRIMSICFFNVKSVLDIQHPKICLFVEDISY